MKGKKDKWLAPWRWIYLYRFLGAALLCFLTTGEGLALDGVTTRVSVDSNGNQVPPLSGSSHRPSISADGRFVAFTSNANSLVSGDTNGFVDIFVHDLQTGETTRVSVDSNGNEGSGGSPGVNDRGPSISADGRYVAFNSSADLGQVANAGFGYDIFVHDRLTGQTTLLDVHTGIVLNSGAPSISADGRYVAFWSGKNDLVAGDTNATADIFVHDRQTGETTRVNVDSSGNQAPSGLNSDLPSISADGRYVAFESYADNLVAGDTNNFPDIFVHDRQTGETTRVNVDSSGNQSTGTSSTLASISANGRFVVFQSNANNLVPGDTGATDVFVHDLQTGETTMVSVDSASGSQVHSGQDPSISADGRYVAFWSNNSILIPGEVNLGGHIYLHDRQTGKLSLVTMPGPGGVGNSTEASISADGRFVAFVSPLSNLVPNDTNNVADVFVRQLPTLVHDQIGVFRNGRWYLDSNGNGQWDSGADTVYANFGLAGDLTVVGDWDGDGVDQIGVFRGGRWYLDSNGNGQWDSGADTVYANFGLAGDLPVVGDWDGDGVDQIGVFRNGRWYLDSNGNGQWDSGTDTVYANFGLAGDLPVVGTWQ